MRGSPPVPRYSTIPFPARAYVPGRGPRPGPRPPRPADFLYAIDLFNARFYWECHEELELLWRADGSTALKGLIQVAAGLLRGNRAKAEQGLAKVEGLGFDADVLARQVRDWFEKKRRRAPHIRLTPRPPA